MSIREQQPGHCPGMPGSRYAYGFEHAQLQACVVHPLILIYIFTPTRAVFNLHLPPLGHYAISHTGHGLG